MRMCSVNFLILLIGLSAAVSAGRLREEMEDNEFAEFEDFEEEEGDSMKDKPSADSSVHPSKSKPSEEEDIILEDEDDEDSVVEDEFDHFHDEEEFEGFESGPSKTEEREAPKIIITKVPLQHLRLNWDSYYLEMLMLTGLVVYFLNFFTGKNKNQKLANLWFQTHRQLLEENFTLVGDDGKLEMESQGLMKESENMYTLWCSGRACCEGMLVQLKLIKRQDLVAVMTQMVRPSTDMVTVRVDMGKDDMDTFVLCIANKKTAVKMARDVADLSVFCPERRSGEKLGVPANFSVMSEIAEVTPALLDSRILMVLEKYADVINYIHFSDQYSGPKQSEESNATKLPDVKKVLMFSFNVPMKGVSGAEAMERMKPLMQLVLYCIDRVKRCRLSKEAKTKADKNRLRVEEAFLKTTHAARAEAAAARREEKKRQEKEKILQEDDPEKQRKWEEREMKRKLKRKAPKMKQLKVKAL